MVSTAAFHARVRGSVPGLGGLKETKLFLPHPRVKVSIVGSLRDREVACSASDRQGSNFESCVWRTVSSQSSHHPQEVLLAQFSLYVHKGGLKPDSFHFISYVFTGLHHRIGVVLMCLFMTYFVCFTGLHHRIRVLRRGCVDIIANVTTGCHDAMDYHDVVKIFCFPLLISHSCILYIWYYSRGFHFREFCEEEIFANL